MPDCQTADEFRRRKQRMQMFAIYSVVAMLLVAAVVGGRLLLSARQTRQLPELLFGFGFLGAGVGLGMGQLGMTFIWTDATLFATVMNTALFGLVVAGVVALHAAIWRVFRPHELRGLIAFAAGSCFAIIGYGMRIGAGDFSERVFDSRGMQVFVFALIWVFTWAGMEAIHLYLRLRKRVRLGLSQPVAASQIGLWGVATSLCAVMTFVIGVNLLSFHRSPLVDTFSTGLLLLTVLGASGAMWCAFFPPAALRSRLDASTDPES
jgi:hypothetical protein